MKPTVAIVGRPNVGKSTLFNRILNKRVAIVDDVPGVTRDRNFSEAEWCGKQFSLIDTGGYSRTGDTFSAAVLEQSLIALQEANIIILVVDLRTGITDIDLEITELLRKQASEKTVFLAVNKVDNNLMESDAQLFRKLGLSEPYFVSALDGRGVAELLDAVIAHIPEDDAPESDDTVKLTVIGRPNVGKSSFVNAILGQNRQIVTDIPGTTRDAVDSRFKRNGQDFLLIDTAGLRRKAKVDDNIELFSALRTEKAIERCDVAIILLDATQGLENQDLKVINAAAQKKRGMVIAVNKWDLIEKDDKTAIAYEKRLREELRNLSYVPLLFISALTKQRIYKAIDIAYQVWQNRRMKIDTSRLNNLMLNDIKRTPPSSKSGKEIKIKYLTQLATEPPLFGLFAGNPQLIEEHYKRFLERKLREHFGFEGTPIELKFRRK
ncbi:small GTP-binding protein [Chloroherpeton thalassium ATCC 35110]|uniref:GTPase Der n=1 Tax=Chloroherpeton thalassium (strain ATCC 35110 / GB-78) TaxID=517418 RepID=DER_CHLT3|nr:ribosome biogenesis GTPase Der [Chloroherpeton thalassium]B3QZ96.1 RecName: Full=GTPase Der; AltName: Full=GTP-binding protein EngA [Chloroherpeton thalassium ATCC 35110]ACF13789.1 small GTP-binding protein [Chloroherpeton thalassium ATCC 35110]